MLSINTNLNASNASTQIANSQKAVNTASERLTTGLRINKAGDDVAGMGLATRLEKASTQTAQYMENAANGVSLIQTADAALKQQQELTARMQELAYQAENGTNSTKDVELIQKEFDQLAKELLRNTESVEYNGTKLLDGNLNASIAVGEGTDNQVSIAVAGDNAVGSAAGTATIVDEDGAVVIKLTDVDGDGDATTKATGDQWKTAVHDVLQGYQDHLTSQRADLGAAQ
ncbi:flagellin, partial [Vibrio sp. D431a]|uniref:flagellin n=1 Tax=Vibrio sp. D431a TaxID=2837388 RepID=UPI00255408EC